MGPQCDGIRDIEASCHGWVEVGKTSVLRRGLVLVCEMSFISHQKQLLYSKATTRIYPLCWHVYHEAIHYDMA